MRILEVDAGELTIPHRNFISFGNDYLVVEWLYRTDGEWHAHGVRYKDGFFRSSHNPVQIGDTSIAVRVSSRTKILPSIENSVVITVRNRECTMTKMKALYGNGEDVVRDYAHVLGGHWCRNL